MALNRFVYLVRAENGLHKIGIAANARERFLGIRSQSPAPVALEFCMRCPRALEIERALHSRFVSKRHHGEWFDLSEDDVEYVKSLGMNVQVLHTGDSLRRFVDSLGRVGYSARCPVCRSRARCKHENKHLLLNCKYCGTQTKIEYQQEIQEMNTMNTQEQDWVIDHVGAEDWNQVFTEFGGLTAEEVERKLNAMFPTEDNGELAREVKRLL